MGRTRILIAAAALVPALFASPRAFAQTMYTEDGAMDARAEVQRWYLNRARFHPEMEADRLGLYNGMPGGHPNYDVCEDGNGSGVFGTTTNEWAEYKVSRPPVAPHWLLTECVRRHCEDMAMQYWYLYDWYFSHQSPYFYAEGLSYNYFWAGSWYWDRWVQVGAAYGWDQDDISWAGENLSRAAVFNSTVWVDHIATPEQVHDGLFRDYDVADRGHRTTTLFKWHRESGFASHTLAWTEDWVYYNCIDYDGQDLASRITNRFFTGTIFYDANGDDVYQGGEGVTGIVVQLWCEGVQEPWYDISVENGSFAIPLNEASNGKTVSVCLVNNSTNLVTVSIPQNFSDVGEVELAPTSSVEYSKYVQEEGWNNVGFRNTRPVFRANSVVHLGNMSEAGIGIAGPVGLTYAVQSVDSLTDTNWITFATVVTTGRVTTVVDTGQGGRGAPGTVFSRFYRFALQNNDQPY